jgi:predicted DNA-binding mobile mystery protein A
MDQETYYKNFEEKMQILRKIKLSLPEIGWIQKLRELYGMNQSQFSIKLQISKNGVSKIEKSERDGTIQLKTLQKMAEELNAELVYFLVPKEPIEKFIEKKSDEMAKFFWPVFQTLKDAEVGNFSDCTPQEIAEHLKKDRKSFWKYALTFIFGKVRKNK